MSDTQALTRQFLETYGNALGSGDLEVLVRCWGIPALVLTDAGVQPVAAEREVRAFFEQGIARYRSQGVARARAELGRLEPLSAHLTSVDVTWVNLDAEGHERGRESWRYVLNTSSTRPQDGPAFRLPS